MFSVINRIISKTAYSFRLPMLLFERPLYALLWSIVGISVLHLAYIASSITLLPDVVLLHRNIYFGVDLLGPWFYIFIFPGVSIGLSIFNFVLARAHYTRSQLISYFLIVGALIVSTALFIGSTLVIRDNI